MSRRSRAVKKGILKANRAEERRLAWQTVPPAVKVGLFLFLVVFVAGAALLNSGNNSRVANTTTSQLAMTETDCVSLRRRWNAVVDHDFESARQVQARYRARGCYALCGDLVEDTDTPRRETRCGDDAIIPKPDASPNPTAITAPPVPTAVRGYEPDGAPVKLTLRLYGDGTPILIQDFPVTMIGCSQGLSTTRWRSLAGPITAAVTSFTDDPENVDRSDIREAVTEQAGLVRTEHQCDQPVFLQSAGSQGMVDVAIEYQAWRAAP